MITKLWLISILVLALLVWDGVAGADATLDRQLIKAAENGDLGIVKALPDKGAHAKAQTGHGGTAMMTAAHYCNLEVARLLIEKGAQINVIIEGDPTPLMAAVWGGQEDIVKLLIEKGAQINARHEVVEYLKLQGAK